MGVIAFVAVAAWSAAPDVRADAPAQFAGLYLGLNTGYGFGASADSCACSYLPAATGIAGGDGGFLAGGEVGYAWRWNIVFIEAAARASYADLQFSESCAGGLACGGQLDWLGEAQVSAGVLVYDQLALAGTIGYATGDVNAGLDTSLHDGHIYGARLEQGMSDGWRMALEYRYHDMSGSNVMDVRGTPASVPIDWTTHALSLAIRYELR